MQRHATLADVIAWSLAVPVWCATPFLFRVPFVMDRFEMELEYLHVKLTHTTILFRDIPLFAWIVVPLAVSTALALLMIIDRPRLRIISSVIGLTIVGTMLYGPLS